MNLRKWMEEKVRASGMQPFPSLSLSTPLIVSNQKKAMARQRQKQQQQAVLSVPRVDEERSSRVVNKPRSTKLCHDAHGHREQQQRQRQQ